MPVTQQQLKFTPEGAERFATVWAGFDVGNSNDAEAKNKGNALRHMMAGKTLDDGAALRLVDALELSEIRAALDAQMQPVRLPVPDVAAMQECLWWWCRKSRCRWLIHRRKGRTDDYGKSFKASPPCR
jgi:hypothetical protein